MKKKKKKKKTCRKGKTNRHKAIANTGIVAVPQ